MLDWLSIKEKKGSHVLLYPVAQLETITLGQAMLDLQCVRALSDRRLKIWIGDGGHVTLPESYHVAYLQVTLDKGATFDGNGCTVDTLDLETVTGACNAYSIVVLKEANVSAKDESAVDLALGHRERTVIHDYSDVTATLRLSYKKN